MPSSAAVPGHGGVRETIPTTRCLAAVAKHRNPGLPHVATVQFFGFEKVLNGIVSPDPEELVTTRLSFRLPR